MDADEQYIIYCTYVYDGISLIQKTGMKFLILQTFLDTPP